MHRSNYFVTDFSNNTVGMGVFIQWLDDQFFVDDVEWVFSGSGFDSIAPQLEIIIGTMNQEDQNKIKQFIEFEREARRNKESMCSYQYAVQHMKGWDSENRTIISE